jgi:hypothetical protein
MPRAKRRGPTFRGALATPIDIDTTPPLSKHGHESHFERRHSELHRQRLRKLQLLAEYYEIRVDGADEWQRLAAYWGSLAMRLATDFVPGFAEKKQGRWTKTELDWIIEIVDWAKQNKAKSGYKSELDSILPLVKAKYPELARAGRATEAKKRARTLCNLLSKRREIRRRTKH